MEVLDGVAQLLEIILSSPLQRCVLLIFKISSAKHMRHTLSLRGWVSFFLVFFFTVLTNLILSISLFNTLEMLML